ncbi:fatty acid synthase S-acetyltransferase [Nannizzia gypsea CBS 118893]|uniref:Non-reducing polyketide synthase nscA n=1 Tax=Arthroderma gypseum (strain ATCC MYA-4604 / CBS 118893) TaxID=535722 RepID=E4UR30_ARTGP|nr:fatty acid synthase S-acetyltransferase [Nannizzia gypsea CBS 118893]EFR00145.1 fatty acid synthase S-acetyltransferase [Nannizzia gypsea CBS 118893]
MDGNKVEPIAVVGIGCRYPGGITTVHEFWDAIRNGTDTISEVPQDRFNVHAFHDPTAQNKGRINNVKGGFLEDIDKFDAEFFGYFPKEACRIDPQQRLILEASIHALEDSGTRLDQVSGSRMGVFAGTFQYDYAFIQGASVQRDQASGHSNLGAGACGLSNRVSHRLNLQGPSVTVDTACSASMVALHLACQSIWTGESTAAFACGVNAILRPEASISLSMGGYVSKQGVCKPFDKEADGYVRSEGVGVVYLKPLAQALRDKDRIYALVRGSLLNQDGYTEAGFSVPNPAAQMALLQSVYERSGIDPGSVSYVEAHGPGTPIGDPIELRALGERLGQARPEENGPLLVGSAKGNFGHTEGASGITGFIKGVLVAFHAEVPPQINLETLNPDLDFNELRVTIPQKATALPLGDKKELFIGVNSFGAGGTNGHVILQNASPYTCQPRTRPTPATYHSLKPFIVSARSTAALDDTGKELACCIRATHPTTEDISYTLNRRRTFHSEVAVIAASSLDDLCLHLDQLASGGATKEILSLHLQSNEKNPKVAFVFSGQGGQWLGMGMSLAIQEPVFRQSLADFDAHFTGLSGWSLRAEISAPLDDPFSTSQTTVVQPAIAAIQIALAKTLASYGVHPDAVIGHSVGEVAAAHISGALTLEETVKVIYWRSQIQSKAQGQGAMLAVGLSSTETQKHIWRRRLKDRVEIAGLNGPQLTTLSGETEALKQLLEDFQKEETFAKFVKVNVPYHSRFMDPYKEELIGSLSSVQGKEAAISLYSTVTATKESGTHLTAEYWFKNIRRPVKYLEAVSEVLKDGHTLVIEIGPHPVLVGETRRIARSLQSPATVLPSMCRNNDTAPLVHVLGVAHIMGFPVKLEPFTEDGGSVIDLPLYPFQRQRYWFENPEGYRIRQMKENHPFLESYSPLLDDGRGIVRLRLSTGVSPFLADHIVDGEIVFPMTGQAEVGFLSATVLAHQQLATSIRISDMRFEHALVMTSTEDFPLQAQLEVTSAAHDFIISSRAADAKPGDPWQIISRGRVNGSTSSESHSSIEELSSVRARIQTGEEVNIEKFYLNLDRAGLRYGDAFRGAQRIWRLGNEIFAFAALPEAFHQEAARFRIHPALLDASLHTLYADQQYRGNPTEIYLPYAIEEVEMFDARGAVSTAVHIQITRHDDMFICGDVTVWSSAGDLIAIAKGFSGKRVPGRSIGDVPQYDILFIPEPEEDSFEIMCDNVVLFEPQSGVMDCTPAIRSAFPGAHIQKLEYTPPEKPKIPEMLDYPLDGRGLIVVPSILLTPQDDPTIDLQVNLELIIHAIVEIANRLHSRQGATPVVVISRGACMTPVDSQCDPFSSALQAAVRVAANELPWVRIRLVDLALGANDSDLELLECELRKGRLRCDENVVALRPGGIFVKRLIPLFSSEDERCEDDIPVLTMPARGGRYFAEPDPGGSLDGIKFRQCAPRSGILGPEDVSIDIHYAGLNFKDVINSLGLLNERAVSGSLSGLTLGMEVSGTVSAIGEKVQGLEVGDEVVARVANGIAGNIVTDQSLVQFKPKAHDLAQAAAVAGAMSTAYYALVSLAKLTEGESVLIHAAAGGVGMAAIQIAHTLGAHVYATAGRTERREVVAKMSGVRGVFDSRSVSFRDAVKKATNGRGVDVVLNSLAGELLAASVECLAPFGRFVEIGKIDIYRNMRLGLEQLGQNCSFFVVDMDRLVKQKPERHHELLRELYEFFNSGKLEPLPLTSFPVTELKAAMIALSRSEVIGRAVIEMPEGVEVPVIPYAQLRLHSDQSYLITGGAGGLGLQLAVFLADRGAKNVVLVSRSGPKSADDRATIECLRRQGVKVWVELADVTVAKKVHSLFSHEREWPTVSGVIHCAAVSGNDSVKDTTSDTFQRVFDPKAKGAWHLHQATKDMPLEFFVLISSIASSVGIPGQLAYSAANQFLDNLAHHRRKAGLTALAMNYGVMGNFASIFKNSGHDAEELVEFNMMRGLFPMSLPEVLSTLEKAMIDNTTQRMAADVDWRMFVAEAPHLVLDGTFISLPEQSAKMCRSDGFGSGSGPRTAEEIADILHTGLAKILGVEESKISRTTKLDRYVTDSLTLAQVRGMIQRDIKISYPVMKLFGSPTLESIAQELERIANSDTNKPENMPQEQNHEPSQESLHFDKLTDISAWFIRGSHVAVDKGQPRLICIHPIATDATFFAPYLINPPQGLDSIAVQLPGRDNRIDEPIPSSVSEIVSGLLKELESTIGVPAIIWGHSFGGIVAFETIRELRRRGVHPLPRLVVSATVAPRLLRSWQKRPVMQRLFTDSVEADYFISTLRSIEDAAFVRSILPHFRRDAPWFTSYEYAEEEPLNVPITAFAARQDDFVYPDQVEAWREQTDQFEFTEVDGDHWFVRNNQDLIHATLEKMVPLPN